MLWFRFAPISRPFAQVAVGPPGPRCFPDGSFRNLLFKGKEKRAFFIQDEVNIPACTASSRYTSASCPYIQDDPLVARKRTKFSPECVCEV